jgi:hypothetical protein
MKIYNNDNIEWKKQKILEHWLEFKLLETKVVDDT